jgi:hypothetical protein
MSAVTACTAQPNVESAAPSAKISANADAAPLLLMTRDGLALSKQLLAEKDPVVTASLAALTKRADRALTTKPRSVTDKSFTPESGDKRDYVSIGPYWWPNPDTKSGLPYVRRDGERNPEAATDGFDSDRLVAMANDCRDLSLAYYFTGEGRYATQVAKVLRTWFLDSNTRMNPNLKYGQSIPGLVAGRGAGLIDTRHFVLVIDAAMLIEKSGALPADDMQALRKWFMEFTTWMNDSDIGQEEAASYNNHGLFYDAQMAAYYRFTGQNERARRVAFNSITLRIMGQIDKEGRMPHELERTRPFHYTTFALLAATQLARHADVIDAQAKGKPSASTGKCGHRTYDCPLGYWNANVDGRSLRKAVKLVAKTVIDPSSWKLATKVERSVPMVRALPVLLMANSAISDPDVKQAIKVLREQQGSVREDVSWLMWPSR